jgi:hypothetical protein
MGRRGRTSAAAAELHLVQGGADQRRPDPPAALTAEEAEEWRAIVGRMPADWFPRETHPLLAAYCGHAVAARRLALAARRLERARKFDLDQYERVSKLLGRETQLLSSLATRMRLTQHSSYDRKKAKGPSAPPPWED